MVGIWCCLDIEQAPSPPPTEPGLSLELVLLRLIMRETWLSDNNLEELEELQEESQSQ